MSIVERSFRLPFSCSVTFTWAPPDSITVEWDPCVPSIRERRAQRKFRAAYNDCRREFWQEVASVTGKSIAILDTDGQYESVDPPTMN